MRIPRSRASWLLVLGLAGILGYAAHRRLARPWVKRHLAPSSGAGARSLAEVARVLDPRTHRIGDLIADLEFTDHHGRRARLSEYAGGAALVIAVRDSGCPVSKREAPRLAEIEKEYAARGVAFLYLNTSLQDDAANAAEEIRRYGFGGRYALDKDGRFGRELGIRTTTDTFVLDRARTLVYRGAVDDQVGRGVVRPQIGRQFLREALDSVLAAEPVTTPATFAPGCYLDFPQPAPDAPFLAPKARTASIGWHDRVSRILQRRCQRCHQPGGAGPFALTTYVQAKGRSRMIRKVLEDGIMPPWFADPNTGSWANDPRPTDEERRDLLAWIEAGCPEGDPASAPVPLRFKDGWVIGEPDLVIQIPEPVAVPASGVMDYKRIDMVSPRHEDAWVTAIQILPDVPEVVHHVLIYMVEDGKQPVLLDGMVPGKSPTIYPDGMAKFLPGNAHLHFGIHYTPNGTATKDQLRVGLKLAAAPPEREVFSAVLDRLDFVIPAGRADYPVEYRYTFPEAVQLRVLLAHMHLRGSRFSVEAMLPDRTVRPLLKLSRWDQAWQLPYIFAEPPTLPAGTTIRATGWYDNSAANLANPDPTVDVKRGEQLWDEMMSLFVEWVFPIPVG